MRIRSLITDWRVYAALLAVLLGAVVAAERLAPAWLPSVSADNGKTASALLTDASVMFQETQRSVRRVATQAAEKKVIVDGLAGRTSEPSPLFFELARVAHGQDVALDLYNADRDLVAWHGRSGPKLDRDIRVALEGGMRSSVVRSAMASELFVVLPVRDAGRVVGVIAARKPIELHYPLTNRYLTGEGLSGIASRKLNARIKFLFGPGVEIPADSNTTSAVLLGIDSAAVGVVHVTFHPDELSFADSRVQLRVLADGIAVLLFVLAATLMLRKVWETGGPWRRCMSVAVLLWSGRYLLILLELPSGFTSSGIFSPSVFASPFGAGLADSPAELLLTALALFGTVAAGVAAVAGTRPWVPGPRWARPLRIVCAALASGLFFWILRGYGATLRSAVIDSSLEYGDPTSIISSGSFLAMMMALVLITASLVAFGTLAAFWLVRLVDRSGERAVPTPSAWVGAALLLAAWAVAFGPLQETPLMSTGYRLAAGGGFLLLAALARARIAGGTRRASAALPGLGCVLVVALWYPLFSGYVAEKDRGRIERFAEELVRPVDSWFAGVVTDALAQLSGEQVLRILDQGDEEQTSRLAFTAWAQSIACREGYAAEFVVEDAGGHTLSRFAIGDDLPRDDDPFFAEVTSRRDVHVSGRDVNAIRYYGGTTEIRDARGSVLGYGRALVAAARQTLFLGQAPSILRGASSESIEAFYRPVTVAEIQDGVALPGERHDLPLGYTLPETVVERFQDPAIRAVWVEETVARRDVETYFVRREPGARQVIAIIVDQPGTEARVILILKLVATIALVAAVWAIGMFVMRVVRQRRPGTTFQERVLLALLVTALVPLGLTAAYVRWFAGERLLESTAAELRNETATVAASADALLGLRGGREPGGGAERVAEELGTDFNLYVGSSLRMSSRPALYETGILDTRINGAAFAAIVLEGEKFHLETESVGGVRFAVGYRPIVDSAGTLVAVVSVPTLFKQEEIDRETARTDAFLFGLAVVVLGVTSLLATAIAGRIAAPIQRLTDATRRLSRGDLDVTIDDSAVKGEVGELLRSFDRMTRDLRESRTALVRTERELAWKEMARQVAHEIRNPLTPMKLSIQHLRQTYRDGAANFGAILDNVSATIIAQIDTMSRIASEFSRVARMPTRQTESADINAIVREAVDLFARDGQVRFQMDLADALPRVRVDREELRRGFINIIRNGVQAMDGKGVMEVRSEQAPSGVTVSFADHGCGMTEEVQAHLFEPNFSTKADGMGLGLALVKQTMDDLGGTVTVESAAGKGTKVTLEFPVQDPSPGPGTGSDMAKES